MNQADLQPFLEHFFQSRQAEIIEQGKGILTVKLTEDLDRQLMNRPFYWQYVKKLGKTGETMNLTLITSEHQKNQTKGEWIHYGSPRLEQLFRLIQKEGSYTTLFETNHSNPYQEKTALQPWFVCNIRVKYRGYRPENEIVSIGILLLNGTMRFEFMDEIQSLHFTNSIPDYCYTLPTIISPNRALDRITSELTNRIIHQSDAFATKSYAIYEREKSMLEKLAVTHENEHSMRELAQEQIFNRLYPQVDLQWINAGLFYVTEQTSKNLIKG